ncbi:hypothetical protein [Rhodoferax sp. UBA5149]|uniref:hypothetical protein n=1 Tax=Rhodoferax sp. UBA5149 TaxID=1947379 RepID=UPI0025F0CE90|nr:hypothetical protein [Rhodoferax sp. UBA5149]
MARALVAPHWSAWLLASTWPVRHVFVPDQSDDKTPSQVVLLWRPVEQCSLDIKGQELDGTSLEIPNDMGVTAGVHPLDDFPKNDINCINRLFKGNPA